MLEVKTAASEVLSWTDDDEGARLPSTRFLPLLRSAVAAFPDAPEPKLRLARGLFHAGQLRELMAWLAPAIEDQPLAPELLHLFGCAASAVEDDAKALIALRRSTQLGFGPSWGYLAELLLRADEDDGALKAALEGLRVQPSDFKALGVATRILLSYDETHRLWALCQSLRERGAWGGYLPSAMAHAVASVGQVATVEHGLDVGRWPRVLDRAGPGGFAPQLPQDFDRRLSEELLASSRLAALPPTKSTRGGGSRIDQLHLSPSALTTELFHAIKRAIEQDLVGSPIDAATFLPRPPEQASLEAWAIAVYGDGREVWHIHPNAWLSGVYYVATPPRSDGPANAGTIEFGPMPLGTRRSAEAWPLSQVSPRPGRLLLFPSFFGHRTRPTGSGEVRLCIAFNVIALETPQAIAGKDS